MTRPKGGHNKEYHMNKVERYFTPRDDKKTFLEKNWPYLSVPSLDTKMTCVHCRDVYDMAEYRVYGEEWQTLTRTHREMRIVCKNHETCGGNARDMVRATERDIKAGKAIFEV
jgi:hypothetical protein